MIGKVASPTELKLILETLPTGILRTGPLQRFGVGDQTLNPGPPAVWPQISFCFVLFLMVSKLTEAAPVSVTPDPLWLALSCAMLFQTQGDFSFVV